MVKKPQGAAAVLKCGLIGMIAVLLTILCDFILIGRATSSVSFFELGTKSMSGLAQWRILLGTFGGIVLIPLQLSGLIPVFRGLRPSGKNKSLFVVFTAGHAMTIAVAFHSSYAFIASGWTLSRDMETMNRVASEMMRNFDLYWKITLVIMAADLVLSSLLFVFLLLKGNTLYPKWAVICNPGCIFLYVFLIVLPLPAPVGGYIAPAFLNISTLVFFTISTIVVYKSELRASV
jgi:hypothetical protein